MHIKINEEYWKTFAFRSKKLDRKLLKNLRPDVNLDQKSVEMISRFMARRYWRIALADEFNKRTPSSKRDKKEIENLEKQLHELGCERILFHKSNLEEELEDFLDSGNILYEKIHKIKIIAITDESDMNMSIDENMRTDIERRNKLRQFSYFFEKRPEDQRTYEKKDGSEEEENKWKILQKIENGIQIESEPQVFDMNDISLKVANDYFIWDTSAISIINNAEIPEP